MKLELRKKLLEDVTEKFGADAARVIDYLFEMGTLDECLARQHMIRVENFKRLLSTDTPISQIKSDLSEDFFLSLRQVNYLTSPVQ